MVKKLKRTYRKLTHAEILDAILAGKYQVDPDGTPLIVNGTVRPIARQLDPQKRECCFIYLTGGRLHVTVGMLVWMIANQQVVPDGFHVDHADRDKYNNRPENLRLLDASENSSQNQHYDEDF